MTISPNSARDTDNTTRVSIWIDTDEIFDVKEYAIDFDVMNLGDPFRLVIGNPDGRNSGKFSPGQLCKIYIQDPAVGGGEKLQRIIGRVTSVEYTSDMNGGEQILVGGADLGWHLQNCHAPLWRVLQGITYGQAVERFLDSSWGFQGVEFDNLRSVRLNQGRIAASQAIARQQNFQSLIYPLQVEPGMSFADFMVDYARRAKRFINVTADGWLVFFEPNDTGTAEYSIDYHRAQDKARTKNNVKAARVMQSIDGLYTSVICVGQRVVADQFANNSENQNATKFRGTYQNTGSLPFTRLFTFADGDQLTRAAANDRAEWKWRRGRYESERHEYTVKAHHQGGKFWTPDTCASVSNTVHGRSGKYYISGVRFTRTMRDGTQTQLTVHPSGFLSA